MLRVAKPFIFTIATALMLCTPAHGQIMEATAFATEQPGSNNVSNMVVSPDNRHLYALSGREGTLASYSINPQTGELTQFDLQMVEPAIFPESAVSQFTPDGRFLYLRRSFGSQLMLYTRNLSNGMIQLANANIAGIPDNLRSQPFTLSPDGQNLYLLVSEGIMRQLRVFQINTDGTLTLLQSIAFDTDPNAPHIPPDGRHLYMTGSPNAYFARNPVNGTLQLIGDEPSARTIFSDLLFTRDSETVLFSRGIPGSPPGIFYSFLPRNTQSGEFIDPEQSILGSPTFINSNQLFSLIDNDRFLVQSVPLRLFRYIRESGASFEIEGGIVDNLSTGATHQFTSQLTSPNERFYFLGLQDGIVVFRINGTGIGIIPSVPAMTGSGLLIMVLLLLIAGAVLLMVRSSAS